MNIREEKVIKALEADGWKVVNSGWPDLLVTRIVNGKREVAGIEVKGLRDNLRDNQHETISILSEIMPIGIARCNEDDEHIEFRKVSGELAGWVKEGKWND